MKNTQFSAKCRYCIPIHQGALSRATLGVSKVFLFCFVISKWDILVNSEALNLEFLFIVSSLSGVTGVRVDSMPNFGFSSKAMKKNH